MTAVLVGPTDGSQDVIIPVECDPCDEEQGECEGKVTELTLKYTGDAAATVRVDQKDRGQPNERFNDTLEPGEEFTIIGDDNQGTLGPEIKIYVGGVLVACIHTSCSEIIGINTKCGDFEIVDGASRNGGPLPTLTDPDDFDDACDVNCEESDPAPGKSSSLSTLWGRLKTE